MKFIIFLLPLILISCGQMDKNTETISKNNDTLENQIDTIGTSLFLESFNNLDTIKSKNYSFNESLKLRNQLIGFCKPLNTNNLNSSLDRLKNTRTDSSYSEVIVVFNRTIINDFNEQEIKITLNKIIDNQTIFPYKFIIRLISLNNNIVEYKIVETSNIQINNEWSEIETQFKLSANKDKVLYSKFIEEYFAQYSLDLDSMQLWSSEIVYGRNCGITGAQPEYRIKLNEMIGQRNKQTLIKWLKSNTVELQLYAIEGIFTLKNKGEYFDKTIYQLIDVVEMKKGNAFTCSGCTHWKQPINEIVKRIKKKHNIT